VLDRITNALAPGGALLLGLGEGLRGYSGNLLPVAPGEYLRPVATDVGR